MKPASISTVLFAGWLAVPVLGGAPPINDQFAARLPLSGAAGQALGSNVAATRETGEPAHAGSRASRSVWWSWTAPEGGTATLDTAGSGFDTILSIYTGTVLTSLLVVVENDGGALGSECVAIFPVTAGAKYEVCVDGFESETGSIVLNWRTDSPCPAPAAPGPPFPLDGEPAAPVSTVLSWSAPGGGGLAPKKIYGADDRLDIYQLTDPGLEKLWESTVALVPRSRLLDNGNQTYTLPDTTLMAAIHMCPGERFASQPSDAFCSGFLVAPDIIATAGHCLKNDRDCEDTAFVFGYRMLDASTPSLTIPADQVYFCAGIIAAYHPDDLADWGLIRLDRPVPDHEPLPIRRTGAMAFRQDLFIIGHPLGLPAKYAAGAWVRDDTVADYFTTNLDAFGGNSGSAVFNADTRLVEGILVAGDPVDLEQVGNCLVASTCTDFGCLGELVTRATQFAHLVPRAPGLTYQVYFGACGSLAFQGETSQTRWTVDGLRGNTRYCWKVVVEDLCGKVDGPVWTFTTEPSGAPEFRRGDAAVDGRVDISDPIAVLFYLFQDPHPLSCLEAADFDDGGTVELTDVIGLLDYLFLDGPAPGAPFPGCGTAPQAGGLGCDPAQTCAGSR